jgi:hypothetical protein
VLFGNRNGRLQFNAREFRSRCEYLVGRNAERIIMVRKLKSGKYRLYSRKKDSRTGKRKNLGTVNSKGAAKKHERAVQYFKHH